MGYNRDYGILIFIVPIKVRINDLYHGYDMGQYTIMMAISWDNVLELYSSEDGTIYYINDVNIMGYYILLLVNGSDF